MEQRVILQNGPSRADAEPTPSGIRADPEWTQSEPLVDSEQTQSEPLADPKWTQILKRTQSKPRVRFRGPLVWSVLY